MNTKGFGGVAIIEKRLGSSGLKDRGIRGLFSPLTCSGLKWKV